MSSSMSCNASQNYWICKDGNPSWKTCAVHVSLASGAADAPQSAPCKEHPNKSIKSSKKSADKSLHVPHKEKPPQVVAKRNARERRRVQAVNNAFMKLKKAVPYENNRGKRLSKVKTLQYAIDYINCLQTILNSDDDFHCENEELNHRKLINDYSISPIDNYFNEAPFRLIRY